MSQVAHIAALRAFWTDWYPRKLRTLPTKPGAQDASTARVLVGAHYFGGWTRTNASSYSHFHGFLPKGQPTGLPLKMFVVLHTG